MRDRKFYQRQDSHKYDDQGDHDRQNRSANEFLKHNFLIINYELLMINENIVYFHKQIDN
ncbi:hypothetical protein GCM10007332_14230 [Epilithonimonas arachidiradicis]|uniref:Uncharacterized protein n=1 Tax=Epilithonimonas arachidiradicis TaxID=1617282 RepID=A0ABQ1X0R8_9FLAO|nr:hypothetical protein GCM10007332_14230 [Epilithonimonas arachidiradicis]